MIETFVFTISPGRSGQGSLAACLSRALTDTFVAFEEPQVRLFLPGFLGHAERRLRRRFIETHELLGRGRVLQAFDRGDEAALRDFARARQDWLDHRMARLGARHYVDVSKHFLHGLHVFALEFLDTETRSIRLVRDPVANMRSYLNRGKTLALDYGPTDSKGNILQLDPDDLAPGEFYLHAWCETYLRGAAFVEDHGLPKPIDLKTESLSSRDDMADFLKRLGLPYREVVALPPQNTNTEGGYGVTRIGKQDIETFLRFRDRLSVEHLTKLPLDPDYEPAVVHGVEGAQ